MNHEHHEHEGMQHGKACCAEGGECCGEISKSAGVINILKWILLGGAFLFSLLTLISLPKIIRKELMADQALKAGGIENYMRLNNEIYETPEYRDMMKQQVEMFIQQNKAQMEMYKQQQAGGGQPDGAAMIPATEEPAATGTGATGTINPKK